MTVFVYAVRLSVGYNLFSFCMDVRELVHMVRLSGAWFVAVSIALFMLNISAVVILVWLGI